jgi:arginine decarboxylase
MQTEEEGAWNVQRAARLYHVHGWGAGYFDVNDRGRVVVRPDRDHPERLLDLFDLANDLQQQGLALPVLLRFSDILRSRIQSLSERFAAAIRAYAYTGSYTTVYPIKVNQQRHVVEEIVRFGAEHGVGLECGSKPELQAVLGLAESTGHLIVCNGYKDQEFIRLALMGQKLGHRVFIVIEQPSEVDELLAAADDLGVQPTAGVRIKLSSEGAGRWAQSGGERSKFGLNATQIVHLIARLRTQGRLDLLKLVHFHIGSQVTDIRYIKSALQEIARYYLELRRSGVDVEYVDVGGGLGVDYDGSASTAHASVNYSLQEYANDVVHVMAEVCSAHSVPMPHLISESGRALTAHHALLLVKVIDVESQTQASLPQVTDDDHPLLQNMLADFHALDDPDVATRPRKVLEVFHDAAFDKERARQYFNSGVLRLRERAAAETIYFSTIHRISQLARKDPHAYQEIAGELEAVLVDRYFCNFSLFQSLPDSWAIDQLFPVMPVHRLDERPVRSGTLQDMTCDSDGKIDRFIGGKEGRPSLALHALREGEDYILGIFLTGAYQEILGDLHNLFGDTNAVHVKLTDRGYEVTDVVHGDTVAEVLRYVQFDASSLLATFRRKVSATPALSREQANLFIAEYVAGLEGYTYLEGEAAR